MKKNIRGERRTGPRHEGAKRHEGGKKAQGRRGEGERPGREPAASSPELIFLPGRRALLELEKKRPKAIRRIFLRSSAEPSHELDAALHRLTERGVVIERVDELELDRRAEGVRHQGIVAEVAPLAPRSLAELLSERSPVLVALDELSDPQNLGSILRVSDGAGAGGVIIPRAHAAPLGPTARKVSAGASEFVPLAVVPNLHRALEECRKDGYWIVGSGLGEGSVSLFDAKLAFPLVLVIGSEHRGMRRLIRESCDQIVSLPMLGNIESLNAGQAASALLYEILRKRQYSGA